MSPLESRRRALEAASRKPPCTLYLLYGEEDYLVEQTAREIIARLVPEDRRDFCLETLSGPAVSATELQSALGTVPLFGGPRVVWLRGCGLLRRRDSDATTPSARTEAFLKAVVEAGEGVTVIITEETADKRLSLHKEIERRGISCEFPRLSETDDDHLRYIHDIVRERLQPERNAISKETLFYLVQLAGTNLRTLLTEIEKLALHAGPGGTIEKEHVDLLVSPMRETETFRLSDAIIAGKCGDALSLLKRLLAQGLPPLAIAAGLTNRMRFMLQAKELMGAGILRMPPRGPSYGAFVRSLERVPDRVRNAFRESRKRKNYTIFAQRPYAMFKLCEAASSIPAGRLRRSLDILVAADRQLKGGRRSKEEALEDLVLSLCR